MGLVRRGSRKDELLTGLTTRGLRCGGRPWRLQDRANFKNPTRKILDRDVQSKMIMEESGRYKRSIPVPYRSAFDYHLDGTIPMQDAGNVMRVSLGTG
jgi:hypothetical protein